MSAKHVFNVYSPKRIWRKMWLSLANFPILPKYRCGLLKLGGVNIKCKCFIYKDVYFDSVAPHLITIGNNVTITQRTQILTHYIEPDKQGRHYRLGEVKIEDDVFIGCGTIICNSVTIGKGALVGAGSVVTKDIPPYQVWAGNPARYIKDRAQSV